MIKKILQSLKYIKFKDIVSIFIFLIMLIPAYMFKFYNIVRKKKLWLICERENTASDNGYHFYKYLKEAHPELNVFYAIDKKSNEYAKVKKYGNIIQYGGLKHWLYYLASNYKISTQKAGNPAPALFYVLHVYLNLFNNRIYLKHGIIKDDAEWWHFKNTKYKMICCGAKKEYDFIKENFGYPEESVKYTGLARFDNLHDNDVNNKQILIMPTWRNWLGRNTNVFVKDEKIEDTLYFKKWNELLNSKKLIEFIEENNISLYFYPHNNMQKFINSFDITSNNIKIGSKKDDIQQLLKESSLMITDYSSVYMDFAYMRKPIIYYQFDKEEYRKRQYQEGYFKYEQDGFGPVYIDSENVINNIINYVNSDYKVESKYLKRMKNFYPLYDNKNCERIYNDIKELGGK